MNFPLNWSVLQSEGSFTSEAMAVIANSVAIEKHLVFRKQKQETIKTFDSKKFAILCLKEKTTQYLEGRNLMDKLSQQD